MVSRQDVIRAKARQGGLKLFKPKKKEEKVTTKELPPKTLPAPTLPAKGVAEGVKPVTSTKQVRDVLAAATPAPIYTGPMTGKADSLTNPLRPIINSPEFQAYQQELSAFKKEQPIFGKENVKASLSAFGAGLVGAGIQSILSIGGSVLTAIKGTKLASATKVGQAVEPSLAAKFPSLGVKFATNAKSLSLTKNL